MTVIRFENRPHVKPLRVLWLALLTMPTSINLLAMISIAVLLIKLLFLDNLPSAFPKAHELGIFFQSVLSANIAACIFYVVSVRVPHVMSRAKIIPIVLQLAQSISNSAMGFLQMVNNTHGGDILNRDKVTFETVEDLFSKTSPHGNSSMAMLLNGSSKTITLNWYEAMARHDEQCQESIKMLWRYDNVLDENLVQLLHEVEFSRHAHSMKSQRTNFPTAPSENSDLNAWRHNYYEYYDSARRLSKYTVKLAKQYGLFFD